MVCVLFVKFSLLIIFIWYLIRLCWKVCGCVIVWLVSLLC